MDNLLISHPFFMETAKNLALRVAAIAWTIPMTTFAQGGISGGVPELDPVLPTGEPRQGIADLVISVLNFLSLLAVILLIIPGIRLILAQGEDEAKDKAKKTIFCALIGLLIVLFAR